MTEAADALGGLRAGLGGDLLGDPPLEYDQGGRPDAGGWKGDEAGHVQPARTPADRGEAGAKVTFHTPQGVALEDAATETLRYSLRWAEKGLRTERPQGLWAYGREGAAEMRRELADLRRTLLAELRCRTQDPA